MIVPFVLSLSKHERKSPFDKLRVTGSVLLSLTFILVAHAAQAWEIESFEAELAVQADGSLQVRETIDADFQGEAKHGIYRDIPLATQDRLGVKRSIRLHFQEATDEHGRPWGAELSRQGAYQRIKLGSADRTYTGRKSFRITYRVERILSSFPEHDELYWNVTGTNWAVPIHRVTAVVRLPGLVAPEEFRSAAYTGAYGSTGREVLITRMNDGGVQYAVTRPLNAFEGLTLVAGWPRGLVALPTRSLKARWFLQDNWPLAIPLGVFLVMWILWWSLGRDLPRETVTVRYEPPQGMTPAEVGTLADDKVDLKDITATLIDLARRGHLRIAELKDGEYTLTRPSEAAGEPGGFKPHEERMLRGLFAAGESVQLSDLENRFYKHMPPIRASIYQELAGHGYWWGRPDWVRGFWWGLAGLLVLAAWVGAAVSEVAPFLLAGALSALASAGVIACFAPLMPRRTWAGARVREHVVGFQEFLRRTDQDRLRRESDPAALFERMLPYAMALGVANQWVRAFEGIYRISPRWYSSSDGSSFSPRDFSRRVDSATRRMGAALSSTPRSSGGSGFSGGSSGGGGGGGGGGSW